MKPTAEELLEALAYLADQVESDCPHEYRSKWLKDALNDAWELIKNDAWELINNKGERDGI
jgi:hypothetical protein